MERSRWQSASRGGKAPRKKRRSSPLPGVVAPPGRVGSRAGVSQPCRRRLFGSAGPRGPEPGSLKRKSSVKTLPKIKENPEVTKVSHSCNQSNQVNVKETTDLEKKEEKIEESTVPLKESLIINFESKESLENAEVTSSTGMTLPTGVSTFLLECLDVDSTADCNTGASDSLNSCPSPETFRDDGSERSNFYCVDSGTYKNSTLLDSSKAVTIDKIPQISNLSAISEPVLEDFQDQYTRRKRPSNCNYSSSALSVSTTLAGKKVCKITAARERTPDLKPGMRCSSPLGPERKPDNQTAKPKRLKCKKKEKNSNRLEEGTSSFSQLDAPGNTSAKSVGLTAEVLPSKRTDAMVQLSSTMLIMEENKALKNLGYAQPAELDPLCGRQEICSIVRTSPCQRPSRLHQIPVNTKAFWFPKGVPEDNITSTKNWIYCKHR
ncbi:meiosis-specific kinetochore protein isoform X2 [Gymnogyps californianus]|uniref:meiosis-specific kinetochore protein isoform X2 n=1 Tax=Gymnogyps californianus TaxID=33616 RepID=UPI0021C78259|nr:meiosis-specific kinetochore protein isoform X2 [Gymnogyps californianus]